MTSRHKHKISAINNLKAAIIRQHGTIDAFAKAKGHKVSTVYAALKFRRGGPVSVAIRKAVNQ